MKVLRELGYLEQSTYDNLQAAYRFLRRLEHGIQAINDQQTQRLPHDMQWQHNLAVTLNFENWRALLDELNCHRELVNVPFERMVTKRAANFIPLTDFSPVVMPRSFILCKNTKSKSDEYESSKPPSFP